MKHTQKQPQNVVNGMSRIKEAAFLAYMKYEYSGGRTQQSFYSTRFKHLNK